MKARLEPRINLHGRTPPRRSLCSSIRQAPATSNAGFVPRVTTI